MKRSYKDVADVGCDDLVAAIAGFRELRGAFDLLVSRLPVGMVEHDLAKLGLLTADNLIKSVDTWVADMKAQLAGLDTEPVEAPPLPHYLLDQRSHTAVDAISAERAHATRWWTHLNEMRRLKHLPDWVAADIGTHEEHDRLRVSRKTVNQALFGSDDLGGDQQYREVAL